MNEPLHDLRHHILGNDLSPFMNEPADDESQPCFLPDPSQLWWLDIETTGLIPSEGRILEVGLMCTTGQLERIGLLHGYVGPAPTDEEVATWPEVVRAMHTENKLIDDLRASDCNDVAEADEWFSSFVRLHLPKGQEQVTLAGSSVHFDQRWLDYHMPKLSSLFSYRLGDISAMRVFLDRWAPFFSDQVAALKPMKQHRVIPDIEDSLVLARFIRMLVRNGVQELMPQGYAILMEGVTD